MLHENLLSVDEFNNPKVLTNEKAIGMILVRLLLLEPGTFETHPEMGVGLVSNFRYSFAGRSEELKSSFQDQINKYLPTFQGVKIDVKEINNQYYITAEINGTLYGITVDNALAIQYTYKQLDEIKS